MSAISPERMAEYRTLCADGVAWLRQQPDTRLVHWTELVGYLSLRTTDLTLARSAAEGLLITHQITLTNSWVTAKPYAGEDLI